MIPDFADEALEQMAISLNEEASTLAWDKLSLSLHLSEWTNFHFDDVTLKVLGLGDLISFFKSHEKFYNT